MAARRLSTVPAVLTALCLVGGCLLLPTSAVASCKPPPPIEDALAATDTVVVADVLQVRSERYPPGAAVGRPFRQMVDVRSSRR